MNPVQELGKAGQSVWLDTISQRLISSGTLARYISEFGVAGLTSNPSILANAIAASSDYDEEIQGALAAGVVDPEEVIYRLAIKDLTAAAGLFGPRHAASDGVDGFVSIEVPPELIDDTAATIEWGKRLRGRFEVPNVLIKVPGTAAGAAAIEELIAEGIGVNVTLLFGVSHYERANDAYQAGLERRMAIGKSLRVPSVASVFVSRWDSAANALLPVELHETVGLAVMGEIYLRFSQVHEDPRWKRLAQAGARPQRLLWASTSTKDPAFPDTYYVGRLVAQDTIDTVPENTLLAFADHGEIGMPMRSDLNPDGAALDQARAHDIDIEAMAEFLQRQGGESFLSDWNRLVESVRSKLAGFVVP
ncbi:MAG: transaldolase [Ferrimicrobium sp.]